MLLEFVMGLLVIFIVALIGYFVGGIVLEIMGDKRQNGDFVGSFLQSALGVATLFGLGAIIFIIYTVGLAVCNSLGCVGV